MLELDLGIEHQLGEFVAEVGDQADEVELVAVVAGAPVLDDLLEVRLAVATDREPVLHPVHLGGGRTQTVVALQLLRLRQHQELADPAQFFREDALLAFDFLDSLRLCGLHGSRRGCAGCHLRRLVFELLP